MVNFNFKYLSLRVVIFNSAKTNDISTFYYAWEGNTITSLTWDDSKQPGEKLFLDSGFVWFGGFLVSYTTFTAVFLHKVSLYLGLNLLLQSSFLTIE